MRNLIISSSLLALVACAGSEPQPEVAEATATPAAATAEPQATAATTAAPAALSPEEQKKADDAKKLQADFAKQAQDIAKEKARFTPELEAKVKALSEANNTDTKKALTAILASDHRAPGDSARDKWRHPVETLTFFNLKPNQTVLEFGGGGGWYTELLAPLVAKNGKLAVTGTDPNGPTTERNTLYGQRIKSFIDKSPALGSKIDLVVIDPKKPSIGADNSYDLVIAMREMHGWTNRDMVDQNLAEAFRVLKPGGVFGVEQHRAKDDADPKTASKNGYLPQKFVIERAEAAGFKLDAKSEINANPKDTKDYPEGVWMLPPNTRAPEKEANKAGYDKAKYEAIGESDRMTLRFVKPKTAAKPAAPPAKK
jgi:predicted methyltransferase